MPPSPRAVLPVATSSDFERMLGTVLDAGHRLHPDRLPVVIAEHAARLGWQDVAVYVVDLGQRVLVPLNAQELPHREPLEIDSTLAGRAFRSEQLHQGDVSRAADRSSATIDLAEEGASASTCTRRLESWTRSWPRSSVPTASSRANSPP